MIMEDIELGNKEKERKKLEEKKVTIKDIEKGTYFMKKAGKESEEIVKLYCKHPDREELIELRKVKTEKDGKLEIKWLEIRKDEEGKIDKESALGKLMKHLKVKSIKEMIEKEIETTKEENGYLVIKAY